MSASAPAAWRAGAPLSRGESGWIERDARRAAAKLGQEGLAEPLVEPMGRCRCGRAAGASEWVGDEGRAGSSAELSTRCASRAIGRRLSRPGRGPCGGSSTSSQGKVNSDRTMHFAQYASLPLPCGEVSMYRNRRCPRACDTTHLADKPGSRSVLHASRGAVADPPCEIQLSSVAELTRSVRRPPPLRAQGKK